MIPPAETQHTRFVRDRFTWTTYVLLAYFAYFVISLGPILPFLRTEFDLNYAMGGMHLSLLALGNILGGLAGDYIIERVGRKHALWIGFAGLSAGALLLTLAGHVALTLTGAFVMGTIGVLVPIVVQAALSDHHGEQRAIALTESNVAVMVAAGIVPLMIGLGEHIGTGWRSGLWSGIAVGIILAFCFYRQPMTTTPAPTSSEATTNGRRLPLTFWTYWAVLFLGVALEWCISLWGATFFITVAGVEPATASASMSLFFGAMIVGRIALSFLVRLIPITRILLFAESIALAGFLLFWLAPYVPLKFVGLFVAGLGISTMFPLGLSAGIGTASHLANIASARMSMAAGLAMLVMPLILGWLADYIELFRAFSIVIILLIVSAIITLSGDRITSKAAPHARPASMSPHSPASKTESSP